MRYRTQFPLSVFAQLDRMQREMNQAFGLSQSIRGLGQGSFPAMNIGHTSDSLEVYVFAPGLDPAQLDVHIEKGVLVIAGQRDAGTSSDDEKSMKHIEERFIGRFRRVVTLPDDIDPEQIEARYRDGVLHICLRRRQAAKPRQITIQ